MPARKSFHRIIAALIIGVLSASGVSAFQMRPSGAGNLALIVRPEVKVTTGEPGTTTAHKASIPAGEQTYRVEHKMATVTRLRLAPSTTAVMSIEIDEAAWAAIPGLVSGEVEAGSVSIPLAAGSYPILNFPASGVHQSEITIRLHGSQQFVSASLPIQLRVSSSDGALEWISRHSLLWRLPED